jgi:hypothetical protein
MSMQLTLDFTPKPPLPRARLVHYQTWLDVSQVAHGVGFTTTVEVSVALQDALQPISSEEDGDYDQRLYDALWLARFELALAQSQSATFTFAFPRKHWKTEEITEVSLRLRVETQPQSVLIGLLPDF